jgi:hypothetical protein
LDIWYAIKLKVNGKYLVLTGKSAGKIRKTVYENFFRKPFSKTRVCLPRVLDHFTPLILNLCSLSLSLFALFLTVPSHPQLVTPSHTPLLCSLSLSMLTFSVAQIVPSQPEHRSQSRTDPTVAPSHRFYRRAVAPICFSDGKPPTLRSLSLMDRIGSDQIRSRSNPIFFFFFFFFFFVEYLGILIFFFFAEYEFLWIDWFWIFVGKRLCLL